jgi:hypothetical protein
MTAAMTAASPASKPQASRHPLAALREPGTIRARCQAVLHSVADGVSPFFTLQPDALAAAAERVARLTRQRFPDLVVPFHSRWRQFEAGGADRLARLHERLAERGTLDRARAHWDLAVVSVLLDAGAGPAWRYTDGSEVYSRSEGLGVASFNAFCDGVFSADPGDPLRVDASVLQRLDVPALAKVFQATPNNPMVGLDGRAALLARLGGVLQEAAAGTWGGAAPQGAARPALMLDRLVASATAGDVLRISATAVLQELLTTMAPIWTSGSRVQGLPAGDVWPHPWAGAATANGPDATTSGWVPFHKLSQWLTYSLLEPLQWAGFEVTGTEALTGLPEYRNGGLLLDTGVLRLRDPRLAARVWRPADTLVVEWRACTVALLDELAALVRARLGCSAGQLPLTCVLEGGTWAAGREIARELRADGAPPLRLDSDGTVF